MIKKFTILSTGWGARVPFNNDKFLERFEERIENGNFAVSLILYTFVNFIFNSQRPGVMKAWDEFP